MSQMAKRHLFTTVIFFTLLTSCGIEDELITFPPGDYISDCFVSGADSKKTEIRIERDFKSQTVQTFLFAGVTNCVGESSPEAEPKTSQVLIIFSNVDLGNGFSYLTTTFEENGSQKNEFIAFRYENSRLYFSPPVTSVGDEPKETFADFISDPDFIADLILTRKALNRPLSKN